MDKNLIESSGNCAYKKKRITMFKKVFFNIVNGFWILMAYVIIDTAVFKSYIASSWLSIGSMVAACLLIAFIRYIRLRKLRKQSVYPLSKDFRNRVIKFGFVGQTLFASFAVSLCVVFINNYSFSSSGYVKKMTVLETYEFKGVPYMTLNDSETSLVYPIPISLEDEKIEGEILRVDLRRGMLGLIAIKRVSK